MLFIRWGWLFSLCCRRASK